MKLNLILDIYNYKSSLFVKTNGYKLLFCNNKVQIALHLVSNIFHR